MTHPDLPIAMNLAGELAQILPTLPAADQAAVLRQLHRWYQECLAAEADGSAAAERAELEEAVSRRVRPATAETRAP